MCVKVLYPVIIIAGVCIYRSEYGYLKSPKNMMGADEQCGLKTQNIHCPGSNWGSTVGCISVC